MCPDVLQYLTYFAGRTQRIQLGSMVVVLPWHDPLRVAEQVVMLDHMSNGRFIFGIGRGLGRVEFEGFGVQPGGQPRDLRRVEPDDPRRPGARLLRVRREVRQADAPRTAPATLQVVPRAHLCGGGVAGVLRDHGPAGHRAADHSAEAVGNGGRRAECVPTHLSRRERDGRAAADCRRLDLLRRERGARRRVRSPVRRCLLALGRAALRAGRRPSDEDARLRVVREDAGNGERAGRPRRHEPSSSSTSRSPARPSSATRRSSTFRSVPARKRSTACSATARCRTTSPRPAYGSSPPRSCPSSSAASRSRIS